MSKYIYPATLLCDFYKIGHREQYPTGTQKVYSTWTPRDSRLVGINKVVNFGLQAFLKEYLIDYFNEYFFARPVEAIINEYARVIKHTLLIDNPETWHIEQLHEFGSAPLKISALKEGELVPIKVPMLTIENTHPDFFWFTNYIETLMSNSLWMPMTNATIAKEFRKILARYAQITGGDPTFVDFQGHDFSMRGMTCLEASKISGAAHVTSFKGTDTVPGILWTEEFYNANIETELIGTSIPATEHSVMSAYGRDEFNAYKTLMTERYPRGFLSIVSDTYNLWDVLNTTIRSLKDIILSRDGKVVIRPDSGDPVKIICGDPESDNEFERKGVMDILWEIFGGNVTEKGFKVLDPHIGCIYGDGITLARCEAICKGLMEKGYASTNMVFGIGSYTYQGSTRDTFGFALKSTYAIINGQEYFLFKDPVTDKQKIKKSQRGRVCVMKDENGELFLRDGLTQQSYDESYKEFDQLEPVFYNGELLRDERFVDIRRRLLFAR